MMSTAECANDYIWYTIKSVGTVNHHPTYNIHPDDVSMTGLPHFDNVLAEFVTISLGGIRLICCHRYNRPVAFKYIPLEDDLEYE